MAFFAVGTKQPKTGAAPLAGRRRLCARTGITLAALTGALALNGGGRPARADTNGNANGVVNGPAIFQAFGFGQAYLDQATMPKAIDYSGATWGYIFNDYIGVTVGYNGPFSVPFGAIVTNLTLTHNNIGGMISFGNIEGSRLSQGDNFQALNGLNTLEFFRVSNSASPIGAVVNEPPTGYGVWPLASHWVGANAQITNYYDYSCYVSAQVDGTRIAVVGSDATKSIIAPRYVNGILESENELITGTGTGGGTGGGAGTGGGTGTVTGARNDVRLHQEISLYRSTARIHWTIINDDSVAHTVRLRFVAPLRPSTTNNTSIYISPTSSSFGVGGHHGFYFRDPQRGVSNQATVIAGPNLPDQFTVYGKRNEAESADDPPFSVRQIFRGFGATLPTSVYVSDPYELRPEAEGFDPTFFSQVLADGIATASYFGPYGIPPGGRVEVYTYYGNGTPTEDLRDDITIGVEGTEALGYNTAAATDPTIAGNTALVSNPATALAAQQKFLAPNPFPVQGSIFNRTIANPSLSVSLNNVSMALLLPNGLTFGTVPNTTNVDTSNKPIGTVLAGNDGKATWYVQPTGDVYGTLNYQMTASTREFGSRTVTRSITIPATPIHPVTSNSFQMLGFPFQFDKVVSNDADPSTVVNGLAPPALRDNPTTFYQWVPDGQSVTGADGKYQIVSQILPGYGYFYRPNVSRLIFANGAQPVAGQAIQGDINFTTLRQTQIVLERGWNIISDPYVYELPLNFLRLVPLENNTSVGPGTSVTLGGDPKQGSQTFQDAVNSGLVKGSIFFYDTNTQSYDYFQDLTRPLEPWQGYWLYSNAKLALVYTLPSAHNSVVVPVPPNNGEPATRKVKNMFASGRAFASSGTIDDWRLQIIASRPDGHSDKATVVGVSRGIKADNTLPKPPPLVDDYLYVGIVRPDAKTRFASVLVPSGAGVKTWDMEAVSDKEGSVTLQWPNLSSLSRRLSLSLKDMATGRVVSLRATSSYQIAVKAGTPTRFQIIARERTSSPLAITNLRSVAGSRAIGGSAFEFAFNLSQDAQVSGEVLSLSGRVVAKITSGRAVTAGETRLKWNGRSEAGSAIPPGPYVLHVTAKSDEGDPADQRVMFTNLR